MVGSLQASGSKQGKRLPRCGGGGVEGPGHAGTLWPPGWGRDVVLRRCCAVVPPSEGVFQLGSARPSFSWRGHAHCSSVAFSWPGPSTRPLCCSASGGTCHPCWACLVGPGAVPCCAGTVGGCTVLGAEGPRVPVCTAQCPAGRTWRPLLELAQVAMVRPCTPTPWLCPWAMLLGLLVLSLIHI